MATESFPLKIVAGRLAAAVFQVASKLFQYVALAEDVWQGGAPCLREIRIPHEPGHSFLDPLYRSSIISDVGFG